MNTQLQSVYDRVALHLLTQGEPSFDADRECAYRGVNNTSCAVGCLIKDEFYYPDLEGWSVTREATRRVLELSGVDVDMTTEFMLMNLQQLHDHHPPKTWAQQLCIVATKYGLSTSVVDRFIGEKHHAV